MQTCSLLMLVKTTRVHFHGNRGWLPSRALRTANRSFLGSSLSLRNEALSAFFIIQPRVSRVPQRPTEVRSTGPRPSVHENGRLTVSVPIRSGPLTSSVSDRMKKNRTTTFFSSLSPSKSLCISLSVTVFFRDLYLTISPSFPLTVSIFISRFFFPRSLSHNFLFLPVLSCRCRPALPPTLFLSLHRSRDLISSLTFPFF